MKYTNDSEALFNSQELASQIQRHAAITLATGHASGNVDDASADDNIADAADGREANRSIYRDGGRTGPGGTVALNAAMLQGMRTLADEFNFRVSEIAGGVHGDLSRHYAGVAFDIDRLNQQQINAQHPDYQNYLRRGEELGATEHLGPGDAGHGTHLHLAWPRPTAVDASGDEDQYCEGGDEGSH